MLYYSNRRFKISFILLVAVKVVVYELFEQLINLLAGTMKTPWGVERIVTSTIILNAFLVVPNALAAIQSATVSSSAPLGGSPVAVGGNNNSPNSGDAKVVVPNGKNNQLSETMPTNNVNTGNPANGGNNPNANGNGLQSKDGDLASRTQTGAGNFQSNNGNNGNNCVCCV